MTDKYLAHVATELEQIKDSGLWKAERNMLSPQSGNVQVDNNNSSVGVINLCANNYLGLANDPRLIDAAKQAMDSHGYGMASVRFICGTQDLHRQLEQSIASDMSDLEAQLKQARNDGRRFIMIATDGVFSMDGYLANLPDITALAKKYEALVMVDDCHSTGVIGQGGRGTASHFGVDSGVDIITGTLGKALGGAIGGFIAGSKPVIDLLRQRARPYLFSNALPPGVVAAGIEAIRLTESDDSMRQQLNDNAAFWRSGLTQLGFELLPGEHPIIPVMLGEAKLAQSMSQHLFEQGVYASGFFFPVVPQGKARIRTQMSAALSRQDLERALEAFEKAGKLSGALA